MKNQPYKYRIHYLLRQLNVDDYNIAMKWFPERIGISKKTWHEWIYRKADVGTQIPSEAILIMALFFGVEPWELLEHSPSEEEIRISFQAFREKHFPNILYSQKFQ